MSQGARPSRPVSERFWEKVNIAGDTDCWEWVAGKDKDGYGSFGYSSQRKRTRAHRVAYELTYGTIPSGKMVCHTCDNPSCVNPRHLYAGTNSNNMQDRKERGRGNFAVGERSHSKLSTQDVLEIRRLYASGGVTLKELSARFGVTFKNISSIVLHKTWKHIDDGLGKAVPKEPNRAGRIGDHNVNAKLDAEKVRRIRRLYESGYSKNRLAKIYGVTFSTVSRIVTGKGWQHVT